MFGAVKMTKNADVDKYNYSGYGICFDPRATFSHQNGNDTRNLIIFGCDLRGIVQANNRANNILVLGKSIVQGINGNTLYAEQIRHFV